VLGEIELVRALALAGIRSAVVARPGDPARYSRFVDVVIDWIDTWREPERLVDRLLDFARTQHDRPVLYYDSDWDLLLVSRHRAALEDGFRFVVPDAELVEDLVEKERFQALAEKTGLPVPRAKRLSPGEKGGTHDVDLRYPLVLKPLTRHHDTWRPLSSAKALYVENRDALETVWPELASAGLAVLAQELVPGPESRIESYHAYVDQAGKVVAEFTGRKIRTHPRGYGYSTALKTTDRSDVAGLGREIVRRLDLRGVAKLDFKRGEDDALHLLEINPRFSLWHHLGARAGLNIPELVHCDLAELPRPPIGRAQPGVRWCSPLQDLRAAREQNIGFLSWLRWTFACEAKTAFAWDDPLPMVRTIAWRVRHRLVDKGRDWLPKTARLGAGGEAQR
jgi:D-aspartate ligase